MVEDTAMLEMPDSAGVAAQADHEPGSAAKFCEPKIADYRSVFETPEYRALYGANAVLRVEVDGGSPLLFRDCGSHAVCLARTASLDQSIVARASETLFERKGIQFVVFEDIHVEPHFRAPSQWLSFHYQNDWIVRLDNRKGGLRPSFLRKMDKKLRQMKRELPDIRLTVEPKPSRELIEAAIQFNRKRIEASGGRYRLRADEQERLVETLSRIGIASVMRNGDRLVSAVIFVECGRDAYAILTGHDDRYQRVSPGMQSTRLGIEHYESLGFRAVHYLWGDSRYKARVGAHRVPLSTLIVPRALFAWLDPRMLGVAVRYGYLHTRRAAKEIGWVSAGTRRIAEWKRRHRVDQAENDIP